MRTTRVQYLGYLRVAALAVFLSAALALVGCQQPAGETVRVDNDDLGGVVTSTIGPEAGVWVIAETTDLPTKFVKIVVTDDSGRYVLPDLPKANYDVWVRGYGLVDSPKVETEPGKILNLTAVEAPNPAAAAEYYPAGYWFSLLHAPDKSEFPGTGPKGNGISPDMKSQAHWLWNVKSGNCWACHQLGAKATREIPESLGSFPSSVAAWERRILSGQAGGSMASGMARLGARRATVAMPWLRRGRREGSLDADRFGSPQRALLPHFPRRSPQVRARGSSLARLGCRHAGTLAGHPVLGSRARGRIRCRPDGGCVR